MEPAEGGESGESGEGGEGGLAGDGELSGDGGLAGEGGEAGDGRLAEAMVMGVVSAGLTVVGPSTGSSGTGLTGSRTRPVSSRIGSGSLVGTELRPKAPAARLPAAAETSATVRYRPLRCFTSTSSGVQRVDRRG
jgi:hypothetical protein